MGLLEELAVRCEAAKCSDRVLDAEIEVAVAGFPERAYHQKNGMRQKGTPDLDRMEWLRSWGVRGYTSSIDAATTIVPKHWYTRLATEDRHSHSWRWELRGGYGVNISARAATPALALAAASLRARHALALSKGSDTCKPGI